MSGGTMTGARRLALRVAIALAVAAGLSTVSGLGALTLPLGLLAGAAGLWLVWVIWDESRGRSHLTDRALNAWQADVGGVRDEDALALQIAGGRPLSVRAAVTRHGLTAVALLTPLQMTTFSFRAWPAPAPRPGFDGAEPSVGGPRTDPLPGVETIVGTVRRELGHPANATPLRVEGNSPERALQILTPRVLDALHDAERLHGGDFRGITFDGNLLGVHWLGGTAEDPLTALHATLHILEAFLPKTETPVPPHTTLH
jgi:hypothetical protein